MRRSTGRWKARKEHDPVETERRRAEAAEKRHVRVHLGAMTYDGLVPITAMADVPDAVAFGDYVATRAAGWTRRSRSRSAGPWCWACSAAARRYAR